MREICSGGKVHAICGENVFSIDALVVLLGVNLKLNHSLSHRRSQRGSIQSKARVKGDTYHIILCHIKVSMCYLEITEPPLKVKVIYIPIQQVSRRCINRGDLNSSGRKGQFKCRGSLIPLNNGQCILCIFKQIPNWVDYSVPACCIGAFRP